MRTVGGAEVGRPAVVLATALLAARSAFRLALAACHTLGWSHCRVQCLPLMHCTACPVSVAVAVWCPHHSSSLTWRPTTATTPTCWTS